MNQDDIRRLFMKAQKVSNLIDAMTSDFNEFAPQFTQFLNDVQALITENTSLKAKVDELEKAIVVEGRRPAVAIAKAIDSASENKA